jgi:hypothetical protein
VLAMIVKHFSFQLRPGHEVWPLLRVTLRPANGLPMIVTKRTNDRVRDGAGSRQMLTS